MGSALSDNKVLVDFVNEFMLGLDIIVTGISHSVTGNSHSDSQQDQLLTLPGVNSDIF
jgi:hypothetical protein